MKINDVYSGKLQDIFKRPDVVALLAGTLMTLVLFAWALNVAVDKVNHKYVYISAHYIENSLNYLTDQVQELSAIQRSIEVLDSHFDRKAFHKLATPSLRFSGLKGIRWVPVVRSDQRAAMEAATVREGLNDFRIKERTAVGTYRVAGRRDTYFPLQYIEPLQGNEMLAGFDFGSNATRLAAINAAIESGHPQVSGSITLQQEKEHQLAELPRAPG